MPADVSQPDHVTQLARRALAEFGQIDILVNSAGANWMRPLAVSPPEAIIGLVEVNLLGAMLLTRAVLPGMLARRHGAIISVGSLSGRVAMEPLYSATKYGLRGFSLSLRRQLAGTGVSVSLVSPGNIDTAMTSHIKAGMPEPGLVARRITGLIAHPRREVVLPAMSQAIAWLEQNLPRMADVVHHRRNWSGVAEDEVAAWTS
jgi:NAD(P)-dependent dehydrogenase (short-subunit alcohol dehydrogenase family)